MTNYAPDRHAHVNDARNKKQTGRNDINDPFKDIGSIALSIGSPNIIAVNLQYVLNT